jgi:hypothetical protein
VLAHDGKPFTGEDVRRYYLSQGYPPPYDDGVWGAAFGGFAKKGFIKKTGREVHVKLQTGHSRKTMEWVLK